MNEQNNQINNVKRKNNTVIIVLLTILIIGVIGIITLQLTGYEIFSNKKNDTNESEQNTNDDNAVNDSDYVLAKNLIKEVDGFDLAVPGSNLLYSNGKITSDYVYTLAYKKNNVVYNSNLQDTFISEKISYYFGDENTYARPEIILSGCQKYKFDGVVWVYQQDSGGCGSSMTMPITKITNVVKDGDKLIVTESMMLKSVHVDQVDGVSYISETITDIYDNTKNIGKLLGTAKVGEEEKFLEDNIDKASKHQYTFKKEDDRYVLIDFKNL